MRWTLACRVYWGSRGFWAALWRTATYPRKSSTFLYASQQSLVESVYSTEVTDPFHNEVFRAPKRAGVKRAGHQQKQLETLNPKPPDTPNPKPERGGGYAILRALWNAEKSPNYPGFLTKDGFGVFGV